MQKKKPLHLAYYIQTWKKKIKDNEKKLETKQMVKRSYLQRRKELYSTSQTSRKQES